MVGISAISIPPVPIAFVYRTSGRVGCVEITGRTILVTVNGIGTALPSKGATDYYHLSSSAGSLSYASVYWW